MLLPNEIIREIIWAAPMTTFRLFMLSNRAYYLFCKSILPNMMKKWEIKRVDHEGNVTISLPNGFKVYRELNFQSKKRYYKLGQKYLEIYLPHQEIIFVQQKKLNSIITFVIKRLLTGFKLLYWISTANGEKVYNNASGITWEGTDISIIENLFLSDFDIYQDLHKFKNINLNIITKNDDNYDFSQRLKVNGPTFFISGDNADAVIKICEMSEKNWADLESVISPEMLGFMKRQVAKCC